MNIKKFKNQKFTTGFTLIESLIVVTIIATLLVVVSINYRIGEKNLALNQSIAILNQDLRRTEEMAMSVKEFHGVIPIGGYGINLKTGDDFYTIFADCNEDYEYTLVGTPCNGSPEKLEQIMLGKKIIVANLFSGLSLSVMNIVFTPPNPLIVISGGNEAVITLSLQDDVNVFKTIKINKAGLIESF